MTRTRHGRRDDGADDHTRAGAPGQRAPLYIDAFSLCEWLLGRLGGERDALARSLCARGLQLHEAVLLAVRDRRRIDELERADEALIVMRSELRLAAATGQLSERQTVHALERADAIGRQVGGWIRSLGPL